MLGGGQFLMPVLTYGFNAGALLTQGGWVSFSCLLAGHFLMLVHSGLAGAGVGAVAAGATGPGAVFDFPVFVGGGAAIGSSIGLPVGAVAGAAVGWVLCAKAKTGCRSQPRAEPRAEPTPSPTPPDKTCD